MTYIYINNKHRKNTRPMSKRLFKYYLKKTEREIKIKKDRLSKNRRNGLIDW